MAFDGIKSLFNAAADGLQRLKFNSWTLGGRGAEIFEKSAEALQLERINPLRGVDEWRLGQIFDDARDGIFADLAWLYNEIEGVEPALAACCEMRESAASECGWLVKTADADKTRGFDAKLADEQRIALLSEFGAVEDDLADLASHLVSAFFRGAAHALPLWNADGSLAGFKKLDLWNFAFDRKTGIWYWNADASRDEGTFQPIPPGELVTLAVSSARHVDHAALPIFIRAALGAKRYGVWLDRFGIPPVAVIMPPNAEKGEQANYMDLARKFARGGNGILPNGSAVSYGTEARAVCPFPDFIRFQQEQIYMIGIGRVQSGANDAANLGGNAAGVVEAGFTRIVRRDARRIARAINDTVTAKVLKRLFPGKPVLAQFAWDTEKKRTSREVLEDAGYAKNAGLAIDIDQVSELTGYKLTKAEEPSVPGGPGGAGALPSVPRFGLNAKTPFKNNENSFKNAPGDSGGQGDPSGEDALVEALSGLFENSLAEAAAEAVSQEGDDGRAGAPRTPSRPSQGEVANSECRAQDPALCPTHGTPQPKIRAVKSSPAADKQARDCGYADVKDMMAKAESVPHERVSEIQNGFSGKCKAHEAIAVISENKPFDDAEGNKVDFGGDIIEHYVEGRRRRDNVPKVGNLEDLPFAIKAVKTDTYGVTRLKYPHGTTPDPLNPPRGTQREYHLPTDHGEMKVFVYIQGGHINGWHVEK